MFDKYVIRNGENFNIIANKFNTTVDYLKDINNIYYEDLVRAGMEIVVPKGKEDYFSTYTVEKGDTLYGISRQYNINPSLLANMNGLELDDFIYAGQDILIPKQGFSYYITKEGDTLESASTVFNTTTDNVLKYNDVVYLLEGQLLVNKVN